MLQLLRTGRLLRMGRFAIVAAALTAAAACSNPQQAATQQQEGAPVKVGLVYSQTGVLASYGKQYIEGFRAGLAQATAGTNKVNGRAIEVIEADDAGDPAKAVAAAKDLIGKGVKILAGSTSSGVGLQVAPIAAQNKVLFVSGPAATDALTGINRYTFRSGRQSYQDVLAAKSFMSSPSGKSVLVFAQDSAFGKANEKAVSAVIGAEGAKVTSLLVPASATDFTPFASQITAAKPDLLFVAWAGTSASAMWQALDQQGVLTSTTVVTGLDQKASYPIFGAAGEKVSFLSHYFDGATDNEFAKSAGQNVSGGLDIFTPDGFNAAQMIVHAIAEAGEDVEKMITALEGWSFDGIKGKMTIRGPDHAMLQPMFQVKLAGGKPRLIKTLTPEEVAPPVTPHEGLRRHRAHDRGLDLADRGGVHSGRDLDRAALRRVPGRHRPQRCRQDLTVQPDFRAAPGHLRPGAPERAGHHRPAASSTGAPRLGAHISVVVGLRIAHGAGECQVGCAGPGRWVPDVVAARGPVPPSGSTRGRVPGPRGPAGSG